MSNSMLGRIASVARPAGKATPHPPTSGGYVIVLRGGPHVSACREYRDYDEFRRDVADALRRARGTLVTLFFAWGQVYGELSPAEVRQQFLEKG